MNLRRNVGSKEMNDNLADMSESECDRRVLRQQWITGVVCFPIIVLLSVGLVSCLCNIGSMKSLVVLIFSIVVWIRLGVGLACLENKNALYFYFLLPLPFAIILNVLTKLFLDH